jgi:hypothetical protein
MQRSDDALTASSDLVTYNGIKINFISFFNQRKYSQRVKVIPEGTIAAKHYSTVSVQMPPLFNTPEQLDTHSTTVSSSMTVHEINHTAPTPSYSRELWR